MNNIIDTYEYDESYDYEILDECKGGTRGEIKQELGQKSIHNIFHDSNLTPIRNHPEWKNAKLCCDDHSYIFKDTCEVRKFLQIL